MDASLIFLVTGLVILVGLIGRLLQKHSKVPESLFLILLGILLGPVLGLIPASAITPFIPLISVFALIVILLEAGLEFEAHKINMELKTSVFFIVLVATFTTLSVGLFLHLVFGWDLLVALLIGLISSGTTTLTAQVLVSAVKLPPHIRRIIVLESILNDITLIVGVTAVLEIISESAVGFSNILQNVFAQFSVAIILGAIVGWAWKSVAEKAHPTTRLGYIGTLGMCFVLYYISEIVGASPILSIFAFALVLGNHKRIHDHFGHGKNEFGKTLEQMKNVQGNFSFFMRSFFFFVLGTVFSFAILEPSVLMVVFGMIALILCSRYLSATIASWQDSKMGEYRNIITIMMPRGFVATVLSFLPAQMGIEIPHLTDIVLLTVFATTAIAFAGTYLYSRSTRKK